MSRQQESQPAEPAKLKSFSELVDVPKKDRTKHELRILETLMARAVQEKDFANAVKVFNEAHEILAKVRP